MNFVNFDLTRVIFSQRTKYDSFLTRLKLNIFKDVDSIPAGAYYPSMIDDAIEQCSVFLVVIGPDWLTVDNKTGKPRLNNVKDVVRIEVESALKRAIERQLTVIPIFVRKGEIPDADELPENLEQLVHFTGISIRPDPDFQNDMNHLIAALKKYLE